MHMQAHKRDGKNTGNSSKHFMEFQEQYQFECFVRKSDVTGDSSNLNSWFGYLCLRTDGSRNSHDF